RRSGMADVLSPHSSLLPPGNSFSPLTLFESTITNAQMLVESMAERELFSALKIIGNLHTHVVHSMEPRYCRAFDRSDRLAELEAAGLVASVSGEQQHQQQQPPPSQHQQLHRESTAASSLSGGANASTKEEKASVLGDMGASSVLGAALGAIKVEGDDYEADEEEEDDCIITEELNDDSLSAGFPYAKIPRLDLSADYSGAGVSGFGSSGGGGGGSGGDVPPECKTIMRRAYKMLKGNGPHLFDFSMPFSAEPNQQVAAMVMAKAKEMAEGKGWPDDVWQSEFGIFWHLMCSC
ncbi:hypothetical protein BOX15_Mlig003628g1, partial [Macrostomum lignano]